MTRLLAAIGLALALAGCGGGSSGGSFGGGGASGSFDPPSARTEPLRFGYFGIDGDQIAETADHVGFVLAPDWGNYDTPGYDAFRLGQMIAQLQEAKARGINEAWIMVGWLLFNGAPGCNSQCLTPRPDGMARLAWFRAQLAALGLDGMVTAFYIDEPELYGLNDATLSPIVEAVRKAWPVHFVLTYSDRGEYPAKSVATIVCIDIYDAGADVLNRMPAIEPWQKRCLIPGGANGLTTKGPQSPTPFCTYAMARANVYAILPFVWFDRTDAGRVIKGIRSNGMAPIYRATGGAIKANLPCPSG